jgi:menaquinone-specific isochorismate synthase
MLKLPQEFLVSGALISPKPGRIWLAWGDWKWEQSQPLSKPAFFCPDFFLTHPAPWAVPSEWMEVSISELFEALENAAEKAGIASILPAEKLHWQSPSREGFERVFCDLQKQFENGTLRKAVPVVFERAQVFSNQLDLLNVLFRLTGNLLKSQSPLKLYGFWNAEKGILGATPEDLFEITPEGVIRTMALAGTRRKSFSEKTEPEKLEQERQALLTDPKERREHQWVIDDIREALGELGQVQIGQTEVLELPSLLHLKTRIEIGSAGISFEECMKKLHPTAALGAFPRRAGWEWLRSQDHSRDPGDKRDRFGAPFGVVVPGEGALCLVAIRNIQWERGWIRLGSGCGVIQESVAEREWEELALKRDSVKRLMNL